MPIAFQCAKCARRLRAADEAAGKRVKCPGCGTAVTVPGAVTAAPPKPSGALPRSKTPKDAPVTAKKRRQPVPDDDEEPRSGPFWLLIAGGSAAVLLVAAVLFFVIGGFGGGQPIASAPPPKLPEPKAPQPDAPDAPDEVKQSDPQPDAKQVEPAPAANGKDAAKIEPAPPVGKADKPGPEKPPVAAKAGPAPVDAKPRPDPVRYLPDETKWVATINVRQLANAAFMRQPLLQIREEMRNQPMLFESFGFDPFADLTRVTVAGASPIGESLFVVARGRFDVDKVRGGARAMLQAAKVPAAGGGVHEVYEFPAETKSDWRFAIADAATVLASNHKDWLLAALDEHAGHRAGTIQHAGMRDLLKEFEEQASVWGAAVGDALGLPPEMKVQSVAARLLISDQIQFEARGQCDDAQAAAALGQFVLKMAPALKAMATESAQGRQELALLTKTIDGLRPEVQDKVVVLKAGFGAQALAAVKQEKNIYRYRPAFTAAGQGRNISIRETGGKLEIKALGKDSGIPASMDLNGGNFKQLLPDAPGSTKLKVIVNKSLGYTTVAGLRFQDNTTIDVLADGSVQADRAGVRATDRGGQRYVSEPVALPDGPQRNLMVKSAR